MIFADVMTALGVTRAELLSLMDSPGFPKPVKIGVSYDLVWNDADIERFRALPEEKRTRVPFSSLRELTNVPNAERIKQPKTFSIAIDLLDYRSVAEPRVAHWVKLLRAGIEVAPVKVRRNSSGDWVVVSGGDLIEAAKREGRSEIECVVD